MARQANPAIAQRNADLVTYFRNQVALIGTPGGPTFVPRDPELARKFGMSEQMVQRTLREADLISGTQTRRRARLEMDEQPKLSNFHALLGPELAKMVHSLILSGKVDSSGVTELGLYLRMTPQRLTAIFSGHADPTIGELLKITRACEVNLAELISKVQRKETEVCTPKLSTISSSIMSIEEAQPKHNGITP